MRSAASWEHWDPGSIPGLAQWVKDLALLRLRLRLRLQLQSDPWPGSSMCQGATKTTNQPNNNKQKNNKGVPVVAQQKWTRLVSVRIQIQSLVSLSGLRIPYCCGCGIGWQLQLIRPLVQEVPCGTGVALRRKKKKELSFDLRLCPSYMLWCGNILHHKTVGTDFFFQFYWGITDIQNCISFRCIA